MTDVGTEIFDLNTPALFDEKIWSDDVNKSQWEEETVVLDKLVVTLLDAMENNPSFFIGEALLRFFTPKENIITSQLV